MGKKKFVNQSELKIAVIGDEETVAGLCLAGIGRNFLVVDGNTKRSEIQDAFVSFMRKDVAMVAINQHIAEEIRGVMKEYANQVIPTVLEIPSKDHPYDPKKDALLQRVQVFFGANLAV